MVHMATSSTAAVSSTLVLFLFLFNFSEAREYLVGGTADSWKIPTFSESDSLRKWAQRSRFCIGDTLVWKYNSDKDSVLQVTKEAYLSCNTTETIEDYKDENTKVKLNKSGPYYFISGATGHCAKGQKLIVVVMSAKHCRFMNISPAPSPADFLDSPAVSPTSGSSSLKGGLIVGFGVFLGFALM